MNIHLGLKLRQIKSEPVNQGWQPSIKLSKPLYISRCALVSSRRLMVLAFAVGDLPLIWILYQRLEEQ